MQEQEYLEQRVDNQIKWLGGKSAWNQHLFKRLRLAEIALGGLIPLITVLPIDVITGKVIVAAAGAAIAVIAGAISLWRFQELWVEYRATAETLKREKMLYQTAVAPYDKADRFALLVHRVEALLAAENAQWVELERSQPVLPVAVAGSEKAPAEQ